MRVLHLITWLELGGIERWLIDIIPEARGQGIDVDVCCQGPHKGSLAPQVEVLGSRVHHVRLLPTAVDFIFRLSRLLRRERYDVLHAHVNSHMGLAVAAARMAGVPVVATVHNEQLHPEHKGTRLLGVRALYGAYAYANTWYSARKASLLRPVSQAVMSSIYRGRLVGTAPRDVLLLGSPPPAEEVLQVNREHVRRSLDCPEGAKMLLHAGSFQESKNHLGLLDIMREIVRSDPNVMLFLAGKGPEFEAVRTGIDDRGLGSHVKLLGLRSDVRMLMAAADLLLLPSLHEGLPIVCMEAASIGLPFVGSNIPSIQEAIGGSNAGRAVSIEDPKKFASIVLSLLNDPELCQRMGESGKERYREVFSIEASVRRVHRAYKEALQSFRKA